MKLLCHIAYHESEQRVDDKHGLQKGSAAWRRRVLECVTANLQSIDRYRDFESIDVVLDVNPENRSADSLLQNAFERVRLSVARHSPEHPFLLTTQHRAQMAARIDDYDYFMYTEDDTVIYPRSAGELVRRSLPLWESGRRVLTCARMVSPDNRRMFYSDIVTQLVSERVAPDLVIPTQRYSACWLYPRRVMRSWMEQDSWSNFDGARRDGGVRVDMAVGYREAEAVVPVDSDSRPLTRCLHMGYCGRYYFRHPAGYHTVPV